MDFIRRQFSITVTLSLVAASLAACAVNPVTGERELALLSESQEIDMGREAAAQARASIGTVDEPELTSYVSALGRQLAAASERPELPWEFAVADDPVPNAFALPGGFIFVTRGLLGVLDSEAELVAVLGHEIGHVTARHSVNQISRAQLAQIGLGVGAVAAPDEFESFGELANTGLGLLFLKYGRDDERQADELGYRYMVSAGYDAGEMADVFAALDASGELAGASPTPGWLASHPSGPERIEAVRARVAAAPRRSDGKVGADEFLNRIDGLVYGDNPRHGFFRDDRFHHPELRFSVLVPQDWRKQNTRSAVSAVSPANDAAMQLTIADEATAASAASAFLAAPELNDAGSLEQRINGHPAVVSRFVAGDSGASIVSGIAAHIEYGGRVYRVLAYARDDAFARYATTAEDIIASFDTLTDPGILDTASLRIRIVELDESMSLAEFDRRYPSAIPIGELTIVNQLSGPDSRLPAGSKLKRISR